MNNEDKEVEEEIEEGEEKGGDQNNDDERRMEKALKKCLECVLRPEYVILRRQIGTLQCAQSTAFRRC